MVTSEVVPSNTKHPQLQALLDNVQERFTHGGMTGAMDVLIDGLHEIFHNAEPEHWPEIEAEARGHLLNEWLQRDPLTRRCSKKPRGYSGDAVTLDILYGVSGAMSRPSRQLSRIPLAVHCYTANLSDASRAVRYRRERLAQEIDQAAARRSNARVLSVACGHLREADLSYRFRQGHVGLLVGLDQDSVSLAEVQQRIGGPGVQTIQASVKQILQQRVRLTDFDLVYSAGLFDYLPDKAARALAAWMWDALRPGGRLLLTNFRRGHRDAGYMRCFMDWKLLYRSEQELGAMVESAMPDVSPVNVTVDPFGCVVYATADKKAASPAASNGL